MSFISSIKGKFKKQASSGSKTSVVFSLQTEGWTKFKYVFSRYSGKQLVVI